MIDSYAREYKAIHDINTMNFVLKDFSQIETMPVNSEIMHEYIYKHLETVNKDVYKKIVADYLDNSNYRLDYKDVVERNFVLDLLKKDTIAPLPEYCLTSK